MNDRITVNPEIHFGKPCIVGTRIKVVDVLELLAQGVTTGQIIKDYYPDLTADDVRACMQYAIDVLSAEELHLAGSK